MDLLPIDLEWVDPEMQAPQRQRPVAVLFDSSLEDSVDQVLALATLLGSESRREARLGGLSLGRNSLEIAGFCELMVRFYRGERPGTTPGRTTVPIGMFDGGPAATSASAMIASVVERDGLDGNPLYPRGIEKHNDTADPVAVLRNGLSAQQDQNAVVVLAGPPVNLLGLMALPEGSELVRHKVKTLMLASENEQAPGLAELIERWPSPIVRAGNDLELRYPAAGIEQDFDWAPNHPVVDAYTSAGTMPYDAPVRAAAGVLYALRPDDDYFNLSDGADGRFQRLSVDAQQRDRAVRAIRERVGARPPEPGRGGRRGGV